MQKSEAVVSLLTGRPTDGRGGYGDPFFSKA
jgi:hypothetical protein